MPLTESQLAYLRSQLGDPVNEDDLEERLERLGGSAVAVALEVQRGKLAEVLNAPAGFSIPGVYSEDNGPRIKGLQDSIARLQAALDGGDDPLTPNDEGALATKTAVRRQTRPRTSR